MYCIHCGAQLKPLNPQCPSCGRFQQNKPVTQPTPPSRVQVNWKRLGIILCIPLVILIGSFVLNNSGSYEIKSHNGRYNRIEYNGSLEKLVNSDSYLLEQFFDGEVDGYKNVIAIYCNDYRLEYESSVADVYDTTTGHATIYKPGLVNYTPSSESYYEKFVDYVFRIKDCNNNHTYYFCSENDVSKWLKLNF